MNTHQATFNLRLDQPCTKAFCRCRVCLTAGQEFHSDESDDGHHASPCRSATCENPPRARTTSDAQCAGGQSAWGKTQVERARVQLIRIFYTISQWGIPPLRFRSRDSHAAGAEHHILESTLLHKEETGQHMTKTRLHQAKEARPLCPEKKNGKPCFFNEKTCDLCSDLACKN